MRKLFILIHNNEPDRLQYARSIFNRIAETVPGSECLEVSTSPRNRRITLRDSFRYFFSFFHFLKFKKLWTNQLSDISLNNAVRTRVLGFSVPYFRHFFTGGFLTKIRTLRRSFESARSVIDLNARHLVCHRIFEKSNAELLFIFESDFIVNDESEFFEFLKFTEAGVSFDLLNICNHFSLSEMGLNVRDLRAQEFRIRGVNCFLHQFSYVNTTCALGFSRQISQAILKFPNSIFTEYWPIDWNYNYRFCHVQGRFQVIDVGQTLVLNGSQIGRYTSTVQGPA